MREGGDRTLYLFRHGQTDWNVQSRFQGHRDIPLNARGLAQAEALAARAVGLGIERVISSDLSRARQTAEAVCARLGVPLELTPDLREVHIGEYEGMATDEILARFGEDALAMWYAPVRTPADLELSAPGGEPLRVVVRRVEALLAAQLERPERVVGVSTHGGVLRRMIGWMFPEVEGLHAIGNTTLFQLRWDADASSWRFIQRIDA